MKILPLPAICGLWSGKWGEFEEGGRAARWRKVEKREECEELFVRVVSGHVRVFGKLRNGVSVRVERNGDTDIGRQAVDLKDSVFPTQ